MPTELEARRPVWLALAELFLDTDVRLAYVSIVEALAASPYSLDELRAILDNEVAPVLQHNLLQVAGEWAGFDDAWLLEQLTPRLGKKRWLPLLVNLNADWRVIAALTSGLREIAEPCEQSRRVAAWRHIMPVFLHQELGLRDPTDLSLDQAATIFRDELWPLMIESVRVLARAQPAIYPSEAMVEENWLRLAARS